MAKKIKCYVRNKIKELSAEAFKIAEIYYGATRFQERELAKPKELLSKPVKIPKPEEINKDTAKDATVSDNVAEKKKPAVNRRKRKPKK